VSTAIQTLPINQLSWTYFEMLCMRLAAKGHNCIDSRLYGTAGQEQQGIDLYAVNGVGEYSVWQCKRYQRFQPPFTVKAVEEFLSGDWAKTASQFRLCVTDDLTSVEHSYAIEQARKLLLPRGIQFLPMGLRELSVSLKPHRDLVSDFFGTAWADLFCLKEVSSGPSAGGPEGEPDSVDEVLISNLMKVISLPDKIWSAPTEKRKHSEVFAIVPRPDAFVLRGAKLYTLANLGNPQCGLRAVVDDSQIEDELTQSWLGDADKSRWLVELLNRCLRNHLFSLGLKPGKAHRYFFKPNKEGGDRVLGDEKRSPKLAYKRDGFWVHRSATIQFKRIGCHFFLQIEPGFMFTTDGYNVIGGVNATKKAMQWGGRQQNDDILRSILFWTRLLAASGKEARIDAGADVIILRALPATGAIPWGIAHDHIHMNSLMEEADFDMEHVEELVLQSLVDEPEDEEPTDANENESEEEQ
jgi:hypothetical protein